MKAIDAVIADPRSPDYITHTQLSLLRQRVYGLALGYEDLNDHKTLRNDPALQTAVDREQELGAASPPSVGSRVERQRSIYTGF